MARRRLCMAVALLVAAPAFADCQFSSNIVHNCGFDADVTTSWTHPVGTCSHDGATGSSKLGSASCNSFFNGIQNQVTLRQCTADAVQAAYAYGVDVRVSASGATVNCSLNLEDFTDDACAVTAGTTANAIFVGSTATFKPSPASRFSTDFGTSSMRIELVCGSAAAFTLKVDDFVASVDFVFADGFETGGVLRWSAAAP